MLITPSSYLSRSAFNPDSQHIPMRRLTFRALHRIRSICKTLPSNPHVALDAIHPAQLRSLRAGDCRERWMTGFGTKRAEGECGDDEFAAVWLGCGRTEENVGEDGIGMYRIARRCTGKRRRKGHLLMAHDTADALQSMAEETRRVSGLHHPPTHSFPAVMEKSIPPTVQRRAPTTSPSRLSTFVTAVVGLGLGIALTSSFHRHIRSPSGSSERETTTRDVVQRVGRLPVMGYNSKFFPWNAYHCNINETVLFETAELVKSLGLADVGYTYVNVDDCYSLKQRSQAGYIVADPTRFPNGMRALTDKIHGLGLKAGIVRLVLFFQYRHHLTRASQYSDAGWFTCAMYPGSFQNEERDVKLFREEWGFDLFKYHNCAVPVDGLTHENIFGRYKRMSDAIDAQAQNSENAPLELALCEWGREQPWLWARRLGTSWRTTGDITPTWASVASIIDQNSFISWASDFYGHGDMDMLEVGNGNLTYEEAKTHFTVWALLKSPLLIGTHLADASDETLSILKNTEIIAINQDPVVGTALTPFRWGLNPNWTPNASHPAQYWSGESQNGTVFMAINTLSTPSTLSFNLTESPWIRAGRQYSIRDLWSHTHNGTAIRSITVHDVPAHGVVALLLQDAGDEPEETEPPCAVAEWCVHRNGTFIPWE
ncbi:Alpha-galactosidase [Mycena chlorophos]|uniref:Alpha-galactosidase n=1 Tax=Mycena chlorophos TaxID=658473 RepID=A0A8H6W9L2_MYCCL|nr:Alpha-galactosidase [Mycena chlorophos]